MNTDTINSFYHFDTNYLINYIKNKQAYRFPISNVNL